jgi:hypothetical protein
MTGASRRSYWSTCSQDLYRKVPCVVHSGSQARRSSGRSTSIHATLSARQFSVTATRRVAVGSPSVMLHRRRLDVAAFVRR